MYRRENTITFQNMEEAAVHIKGRLPYMPQAAVVLGSGLGSFADQLSVDAEIPYAEIPHFPVSTVEGHDGRFLLARAEGRAVLLMKGRVHYYEGYSMQQVVMPVRIMKLLGVDRLLLTNAAGGMNPSYQPGDLVRITDQITSFVPSPLIGPNIDELGVRFPDMTHVYDEVLGQETDALADKLGIRLKHGIYLQTTGPNYETPAEIVMYRNFGADLVGMSTACEAMAARHAGVRVTGISCVTNMAAGIECAELNHEEVQETANRIAGDFGALVYGWITETE